MKISRMILVLFSLIILLGGSFFSDNSSMLVVNADADVTSDEELYVVNKLLSLRYKKYDDHIEICGMKRNSAFSSRFKLLDSLTIPDTIDGLPVTEIANLEFIEFTNLIDIAIPDTVKRIDNCSFNAWLSSYKKNDENPDGVIYLGKIAYGYKGNEINEVVIKEGTLGMRDYFLSSTKVTSVSLPSTLETIPQSAFANCTSLKEVTLTEGIKEIGDQAFYACHKLESIDMPDSVIKVGAEAFANDVSYGYTQLEHVKLSNSLTEISPKCFMNCSKLKEINMPRNLKVIREYAFISCKSLENICLPDSLESIESHAFSGTNIKSISTLKKQADEGELYFPDSLVYIHEDAFCDISAGENHLRWSSAEFPASLNEVNGDIISYCKEELTIKNPNCIINAYRDLFKPKIHGYRGSTAEALAEKYSCEFIPIDPVILKGDCNCDNAVDSRDLLMLQKYLFGNGVLANSENIDLNKDNKINIVDFMLMKELLLEQV